MTLLGTRVAALLVLFSLTLFMGVVPVFLFRYWMKKKSSSCLDISGSDSQAHSRKKGTTKASGIVLQLLMFFGGGVLFATCFVHLIPEVRENFDEYFKSLNKTEFGAVEEEDHFHDHDEDHEHNHTHQAQPDSEHKHGHKHTHGIPYVELAICGGFFIIYFLEELIHTVIGHDHHSDETSREASQIIVVESDVSLENGKSLDSKLNVNGTSLHPALMGPSSPIGILLVIFTENSVTGGQSPIIIILSAVATGTILYIIFFEILRRDRCSHLPGLVQFFAMVIGFVVMLCINLFVAHGF